MLIAFDLDRDQPRNFLLRRIVSDVDIQDVSFDPPTNAEVALALEALQEHKASQQARIRVKPNSAAWFHFDLGSEQFEFETNYYDLALFAEELMEFVDEVEVLHPPELAAMVRANLLKVSIAHA
jgi:predicted DNA-binding transcriptional regulator YafY